MSKNSPVNDSTQSEIINEFKKLSEVKNKTNTVIKSY